MTDKILGVCALLVMGLTFTATPAGAVTPTPYSTLPGEPPSAIFLTALQVGGTLDYVEIYNSGAVPVDLNNWKVAFTTSDSELCEIELSGWLRTGSYGLLGEQSVIVGDDNFLEFSIVDCALAVTGITFVESIYLIEGDIIRDQLLLESSHDNESWVRRTTTTSSNTLRRTNDFSYDFEKASNWSKRPQLYTGGWYNGPPANVNGLQILEILANSKKCSPVSTDLTCGNYIKLYNPTDHEINLADYRLRTGYQGQSTGINNRFTWGNDIMPELEEYILPPGEYFMLTTRNDGEPISITTSGGFVWLEDIYGVVVYEDTIVEYPDASSTTKVGWAWAFNGEEWEWTSAPQPYAPNIFPPPEPVSVKPVSTLTPCRPDQFRNPETNRCKLTASASSTLTPCKPGQQRNLETNRCRSVAGASTILTPCKPGQERNPDTNRCRKIVANDNPEYPVVQDLPGDLSSNLGLWFAGAAGVGAVGYGAYEWRREVAAALGKAKGILGK
jgi:hypothetical protein